ncbi:hypothetical protein FACS189459_0910 [Bacilli bacterium]|nr:hypothetical protein FACS189459_0910 [Bacilli bacterium]
MQRIRTIDTTVVIEDVKISNSLSPNNYYASNDKIETVITVSSMPSINKFINSFKTVVSILFSEPSKDISSLSGELDHMETPIIIQAKDP